MTTINKKLVLSATALTIALGAIPQAMAADALAICQSGVPYVYPNGGADIPFNPDAGPLRVDTDGTVILDNAAGVAVVESAFAAWENLPQSSMTASNAGTLPVDIDITNFGPVLNPPGPDGSSPIVFDANGEIFALLFGEESGILGFAGPDFGDPATCTLTESSSFLNGPAFNNLIVAEDIIVHEFGHYINLGHVELNGQIIPWSDTEGGDDTGPSPNNSTFPVGNLADLIETMYPIYFGPAAGSRTPHPDDIASVSMLYPETDFAATTGTISGVILGGLNGDLPISGVNVIARNINDPFGDAVSTFSGAYTNSTDPADPNVGVYTLAGLTPGEQYAVFVDQVTAAPGRFSNPILPTLPGPEEFYNGADESSANATDDPQAFVLITAEAGNPTTGVNIQFNVPQPGEPLNVGDDGNVELALPFAFEFCGVEHSSVYVNANGHLTFGAGDPSFFESVEGMLDGPPRIAPLWRDFNPSAGGTVYYEQTGSGFTVFYDEVPNWPAAGANSFSVTLNKTSNHIDVRYEDLDPTVFDFSETSTTPGLAGISCGLPVTSGQEPGDDLSGAKKSRINLHNKPARYEAFTAEFDPRASAFVSTVDLANSLVRFNGTTSYNDNWAGKNNVFGRGRNVKVPFNTAPLKFYTEIEPAGSDADHFEFEGKAGQYVVAEVQRSQIDSLMCLFDPAGNMIAQNDDSNGLLSAFATQLPADGRYSLAVTTFPDFACDGTGGTTGPRGEGRYILDAFFYEQPADELVFNGSFEIGFSGWFTGIIGEPFIPWSIGTFGDGAGFDMQPVSPLDGNKVAWNGFDGAAGTTFQLAQAVSIPADATTVTLTWKDRGQWNFFAPEPIQPRTALVAILEPEPPFNLLALPDFRTTGTVPIGPVDWGWREVAFDLSGFAGQTVLLYFEQSIPEDFTGPGQFEIDGVSITYD
jgi:hypothetical protein